MTLFASLGEQRVTSGSVTICAWGCAVADLKLADDAALPSGALTLTIADLSVLVSQVRGDPFAGSRSVRVVGGYGGWKEPIPAKFYELDSGVKLSTVLTDTAQSVGERIEIPTSKNTTIGPRYVRSSGPASRVLSALVGSENWYVGTDGVTRIGPRATPTITDDFTPAEGGYFPAHGLLIIATEKLAPWQPGAIFDHELLPRAMQINAVRIDLQQGGKLRLSVMIS